MAGDFENGLILYTLIQGHMTFKLGFSLVVSIIWFTKSKILQNTNNFSLLSIFQNPFTMLMIPTTDMMRMPMHSAKPRVRVQLRAKAKANLVLHTVSACHLQLACWLSLGLTSFRR